VTYSTLHCIVAHIHVRADFSACPHVTTNGTKCCATIGSANRVVSLMEHGDPT
jgi:hypothetical protein